MKKKGGKTRVRERKRDRRREEVEERKREKNSFFSFLPEEVGDADLLAVDQIFVHQSLQDVFDGLEDDAALGGDLLDVLFGEREEEEEEERKEVLRG